MNLTFFQFIFSLSGKNIWLDYLMIYGAEFVIYITIFFTAFLLFKQRVKEKAALLLILFSLPIGFLLIKIIRLFIIEPRPFIHLYLRPLIWYYQGPSFPSTHTMIMAIITFSYFYYRSRWAYLFLFLLAWVAIARIYAGLHYPLDIIGSLIVAVISLAVALQVKKFFAKFA